jgi:hypothetical protein
MHASRPQLSACGGSSRRTCATASRARGRRSRAGDAVWRLWAPPMRRRSSSTRRSGAPSARRSRRRGAADAGCARRSSGDGFDGCSACREEGASASPVGGRRQRRLDGIHGIPLSCAAVKPAPRLQSGARSLLLTVADAASGPSATGERRARLSRVIRRASRASRPTTPSERDGGTVTIRSTLSCATGSTSSRVPGVRRCCAGARRCLRRRSAALSTMARRVPRRRVAVTGELLEERALGDGTRREPARQPVLRDRHHRADHPQIDRRLDFGGQTALPGFLADVTARCPPVCTVVHRHRLSSRLR